MERNIHKYSTAILLKKAGIKFRECSNKEDLKVFPKP